MTAALQNFWAKPQDLKHVLRFWEGSLFPTPPRRFGTPLKHDCWHLGLFSPTNFYFQQTPHGFQRPFQVLFTGRIWLGLWQRFNIVPSYFEQTWNFHFAFGCPSQHAILTWVLCSPHRTQCFYAPWIHETGLSYTPDTFVSQHLAYRWGSYGSSANFPSKGHYTTTSGLNALCV